MSSKLSIDILYKKVLIDTGAQVSVLSKSWLKHYRPDLMIKENHNLLDKPDQLTVVLSTSYFGQVVVIELLNYVSSPLFFARFSSPAIFF